MSGSLPLRLRVCHFVRNASLVCCCIAGEDDGSFYSFDVFRGPELGGCGGEAPLDWIGVKGWGFEYMAF